MRTLEERRVYWRERRAKSALVALGFIAGITTTGVIKSLDASAAPLPELEFIHLSRFDKAVDGGLERRTSVKVHQCTWDAGTPLICGDVLTDVEGEVLGNVHSFIEAMTDAGTRRMWQERYLP